MLTPADIDDDLIVGIDVPAADASSNSSDAREFAPAALVPDSAVARALWSVWSGAPITIVDSPPGGGKSTGLATIIAHLVERAGLTVTVATPTRRAAADIALRLARQVRPERLQLKVSGLTPPQGVSASSVANMTGGTVTVRTMASCRMGAPKGDVLVVDEAYQATFSQVAAAAQDSKQILMVGDPGQIGPVVTVDTSLWDTMPNAPHHRAPEPFAKRAECTTIHIDQTFRLGQRSVDAIAPLYDFPFTSARVERSLNGVQEIESIELPATGDRDDINALTRVVDRAVAFIGTLETTTDSTGVHTRAIEALNDIAVVVSHNSQSSIVTGLLAARDADAIAVGTADRMQGGQWSAVVALDPAFGYTEPADHMLNLGRLCVMASRHATHLTWVHDGRWRELLAHPDVPRTVAQPAMKVRELLTADGITVAATPRRRSTAA